MDELEHLTLEVRRHNITAEPLPEAAFDLVHTRAHLPDRDVALRNMVRALRPGSWLLVELPDFASAVLDPRVPSDAIDKAREALREFVTAAGVDSNYGRRLFGDVRAAGLVKVDAEGRVVMEAFGSP